MGIQIGQVQLDYVTNRQHDPFAWEVRNRINFSFFTQIVIYILNFVLYFVLQDCFSRTIILGMWTGHTHISQHKFFAQLAL